MYRRHYPDAPGLFADTRRRFRPSLAQELRRNGVISVIGLALVCAGVGVILWNEGKAVQIARALEQGHRDLIIPETNDVVFDENNGKLVFVADKLKVLDALHDPEYGISINAVKLKRVVQMYQWFETEDRKETPAGASDGDHDGHVDTTYSYDLGWFDHRIDSESFFNPLGHHNPESWPINYSMIVNERVKLGDFLLGTDLKSKFEDFSVFTSDERPSNHKIKMHAGLYFHAHDVWKPQVGDIRIQFSYAGRDGDLVTVIGKQSGREIRPFQTESGEELLLLHQGLKTASEVFYHEHVQHRFRTYFLRLAGWFLCFLGYSCIGNVLDVLVFEYPSVRNVLSLGYTSLPFSFSGSTALIFTAFGWLLYRPTLAVFMLALALTPFVFGLAQYVRESSYSRRHRLS